MAAIQEEIDLADLVDRFDEQSRPTYLSLYANLADEDWERALKQRADEIRLALDDEDMRTAFDQSLATAQTGLDKARQREGTRGVAAFASAPHRFQQVHALAAPIPTRLVLDSSPYVRPLAAFADRYEAFLLILVDNRSGALFLVDEARAESKGRQDANVSNRHRRGGMSQMRFQRSRKGELDKFFDQLIEHAERVRVEEAVERVLVAGPGQAKRGLAGRLTPGLKQALIGVEDADFQEDNEDALIRRFVRLARDEESQDAAKAVRALRSELLSGDLATTGPYPTTRAARDGRVQLLVVRRAAVAGGRKCEAHQTLFAPDATCPTCGGAGAEVDLINEAVEYVVRAEGEIQFVPADDEFLASVGDVGAVLRW